jgi:hypothetical protein
MHRPRAALLPLALLAALAAPLAADILLLKDGKRIEGAVADKGSAYEVKTKFGTLTVDKAEVKKVVTNPAAITAEADICRSLARGMVDEAARLQDPRERNRKLGAAAELLDKASRLYAEARELFPGPEHEALDKAAAEILAEARKARESAAPEAPAPAPPAAPVAAPLVAPPPPVAPASAAATPAGTLPPPTLPSKKEQKAAEASIPPPPPKTEKDYLADLASPEHELRKAAVDGLAKAPAPAHLAPLADALKQEANGRVLDALELALPKYDATALLKLEAAKAVAASGSPEQKAVLVRVLKQAGGEPALRFLVDQFVLKIDEPARNDVASALKKHKTTAAKLLIEAFRKAGGKPDLQVDLIRYLGVIGESAQGAKFLVPLLEMEDVRSIVLHALLKIDRPAIPVLIQVGLPGGSKTRNWSSQLLRYFTNTPASSRSTDELVRWWTANRREVEADEAAWDKLDEQLNWPVDERDWNEFGQLIIDRDGNELRMGHYRTNRGRPRAPMMDASTRAARIEEYQRRRDEKIRLREEKAPPKPPAGN